MERIWLVESACTIRNGRGKARFLDYVLEHGGVWICRGIDIARPWIASHPAPAVR